MRARTRVMTALFAAVSVAFAGLAAAAPASAADGFTFFDMSGDGGDYIAGSTKYHYTAADTAFTPYLTSGTAYIAVIQDAYSHWWYLDLRAPAGEEFVPGRTYTDVQRASFATPPHPGLDVSGDGRGCNEVSGSFTVIEYEKDAGTGEVTRFAASFVQYCGPNGGPGIPATRGTIAINASQSPVTITSTSPASAIIAGPVEVSGKLTDAAGPLAGAAVTAARPDGNGGSIVFDATTGADGSFSFTDTMGSVANVYTIQFAGDATHTAASRTITVAAVKADSALSLSAPKTVVRGSSYAVIGLLTSDGVPLPGRTLTITRVGLSGTKTSYLKTSATGRFTLSEAPSVGGPVTWTVRWAGTSTQKAVTSKRTVTVTRAKTSISISSDKSVYSYGAQAVVRVHLGTTYTGRGVALYARKLSGTTTKLVKAATVDANGNLVVRVPVNIKTVYSVKFAGDYRYLPAAASRTVNVLPKIRVVLSGAYGRSGSTYLFKRGVNPYVTVTVAPSRPPGCVRAVAQRLSGSTWVTTATLDCASLDIRSQLFLTLYTNGVAGSGRMMVSTPSGTISAAGSSGWIYYRFT